MNFDRIFESNFFYSEISIGNKMNGSIFLIVIVIFTTEKSVYLLFPSFSCVASSTFVPERASLHFIF
jgi:hypothetical protein